MFSTLRYANRAKNIKNSARINEDPKDAMLRKFQKEIEELQKRLQENEEESGEEVTFFSLSAPSKSMMSMCIEDF